MSQPDKIKILALIFQQDQNFIGSPFPFSLNFLSFYYLWSKIIRCDPDNMEPYPVPDVTTQPPLDPNETKYQYGVQ